MRSTDISWSSPLGQVFRAFFFRSAPPGAHDPQVPKEEPLVQVEFGSGTERAAERTGPRDECHGSEDVGFLITQFL